MYGMPLQVFDFQTKKKWKKRVVETANPSSMGKYFKKGGIMFGNVAIEDFSRHQGNSNDRWDGKNTPKIRVG